MAAVYAASAASPASAGAADAPAVIDSVLRERRGHVAPSVWFDAQTGGPNLSIGSGKGFPSIEEPAAYSNIAIGGGWRPGLPEAGNLAQITTGYDNTAIGAGVLISATTDYSNTAVGADALGAQNGASNNTAVGAQAAENLTTGSYCTAVGSGALQNATTGSYNEAFGAGALNSLTTGTRDVAVGENALNTLTTATDCTAVGQAAGCYAAGSDNTAVGSFALQGGGRAASAIRSCTAVGQGALAAASGCFGNVAIGVDALGGAAGGGANTAVGTYAGYSYPVNGSSNSFFGYRAGYTDGTTATSDVSSATLIGEQAQSQISNVIVLGKAVATRPNLYFGVAPTTDFTNGAQGAFFIADAATNPTPDAITGGVVLYASDGHLYGIGAAGVAVEIF